MSPKDSHRHSACRIIGSDTTETPGLAASRGEQALCDRLTSKKAKNHHDEWLVCSRSSLLSHVSVVQFAPHCRPTPACRFGLGLWTCALRPFHMSLDAQGSPGSTTYTALMSPVSTPSRIHPPPHHPPPSPLARMGPSPPPGRHFLRLHPFLVLFSAFNPSSFPWASHPMPY